VSGHQALYSTKVLCQVLGLSRSGYYAWRSRPDSARVREDAELLVMIRRIHTESRETYGAPRVRAQLAAEGVHVSTKRVARLMKKAGLVGVSRRRGTRTTLRSRSGRAAPDLVLRDFTADARDQLWVADITYVPTWTGFIYLAVILDVWSRKIVGWSFGLSLRKELVLDALNLAIHQRQPFDVIHHSDRGSQYTSLEFGRRCRELGVRPSMGATGTAYDNAMCESFFASLETELLDRTSFRTRPEARMAVFDYIEGFYNPRRLHSALGYRSPVQFEREMARRGEAGNAA
jgi:putative transposase